MSAPAPVYPPERHLLRDLRIVVDRRESQVRGRLELVPEIADAAGRPRIGALATLVDVVAGETAIRAVLPSWTATSDLRVDVGELPEAGAIEAIPRILRSGSRAIVLEVALRSASDGSEVGLGVVGFAKLPARSEVQRSSHWAEAPEARTEFARPDSGFDEPILDRMGCEPDPQRPEIMRLPLSPYLRNSLEALQGGAGCLLAEACAERFVSSRSDGAGRVRSLALHFLELARVGPVRAIARRIGRGAGGRGVRVELVDEGARDALVATATVQVDEVARLT